MSSRDTGGQRSASRRQDSDEQVDETAPTETTQDTAAERHEALSEDVDAILDEIDEVLEENAEDFVRAFVQKGGE
jgi:ubiquitin-like protein Pup